VWGGLNRTNNGNPHFQKPRPAMQLSRWAEEKSRNEVQNKRSPTALEKKDGLESKDGVREGVRSPGGSQRQAKGEGQGVHVNTKGDHGRTRIVFEVKASTKRVIGLRNSEGRKRKNATHLRNTS